MKKDNDSIFKVIKDFFAGKNSVLGNYIFNTWYDSFEGKEAELEEQEKMRLQEIMFEKIQKQKADKEQQQRKSLTWHYGIAAAVGLIIICAVSYKFILSNNYEVYQTTYGELKEMTLPDGSLVTLNGNSKIRYLKEWRNKSTREVWLEGEAFFQVEKLLVKNIDSKFSVHAHGLDIVVLGTQFNVKDRGNKTKVILKEGKVRLVGKHQLHDKEIEMTPGEMAEYDHHTKLITIDDKVDVEVHTSWTSSEIIFDNTLEEIFNTLREVYGYNITIEEQEILNWRFRGSTPRDNPEVLLISLEKSYDINITKDGKNITINK